MFVNEEKVSDESVSSSAKYLVFTSAGDNNNIINWLDRREFDLCVYYYGDDEFNLEDECKLFVKRKAGKMQNFHHASLNYESFIKSYDAILLADDDVVISGTEINKLFYLRERYDLRALQPAFDIRGKISHKITEPQLFTKLRYTNFLEIGFVLFETRPLVAFMSLFNPTLNCWGVDWWFSSFIQKKYGTASMAIIDSVVGRNPYDEEKTEGREITKLSSISELEKNWNKYRLDNNIQTDQGTYVTFDKVISYDPSRVIVFFYHNVIVFCRKFKAKVSNFMVWVFNSH